VTRSSTHEIIPATVAGRLRSAARRVAGDAERDLLDRRLGAGWHRAPYTPGRLLAVFSRLALRAGFRLAAYQFLEGGNGNGFAVVVPADRALPEPPPGLTLWSFRAGRVEALPDWVRPDVLRFVEGDGTLRSYFEASLFARELDELGALWHGASWSTHTLITSRHQLDRRSLRLQEPWRWVDTEPEEWRPTVTRSAGGVRVRFYSHTALGQEVLLEHRDTFRRGYEYTADDRAIARGGGGFVF
jgi:hypothetical protein